MIWLAERRTVIASTRVALKVPLTEDIDVEAVKQEAELWVRASGHPNVLPIIEANIYDQQVVIASEYAPDGSLQEWLNRHGGIAPTLEAALEMTGGILNGLEHLHSRSIIPRDLKPENVLLQGSTPRLADFGISRVMKSGSQSSTVAGTPAYMAPEAFRDKRGEQTDLWSVGVILYQLVSVRERKMERRFGDKTNRRCDSWLPSQTEYPYYPRPSLRHLPVGSTLTANQDFKTEIRKIVRQY